MNSPPASVRDLSRRVWRAVAEGDEYAAVDLVHGVLADGADGETLLLDVIVAVQEKAGAERTAEDLARIVDFLAAALYVDDSKLFTGFLAWTADLLEARHVPARALVTGPATLAAQLRDFPRALRLPDEGTALLTARTASSVPGPRFET
ncbi:hypothetical protein [Streptomyces glaucus]|uniref:Uncharacterized protein n=1 Tax=Streptomyces glaucus TaxID=284029 RepID=A0ABP5XMP7_9ACTN